MIRLLALAVAVAVTAVVGLTELPRDAFLPSVKYCSIDPHYSFEVYERRNLLDGLDTAHVVTR